MAKSVQFQNVDDAVRAYRNRGVSAFAIWCEKQFMFKYEGDSIDDGDASLTELLTMLQNNQSSAVYTLCVYEDPPTKIKSDTPYDGSFNFKLNDYMGNRNAPGEYSGLGSAKVKMLEMEIEKLKAEKEQEPENRLGLVGEILEHDAIAPFVPVIVGRIMDMLGFPDESKKPDDKVGQVRRVSGPELNISDANLIKDLKTLAANVDDLPLLISKLAQYSESKPIQFKMYVVMLYKMKF